LNNIARKIKKGTPLSEKEGKVYDEHRTEIIEIKKLQDEFASLASEEISNAATGNTALIDELKSRLINTGEYTQENLDVLDNPQIFDIAFEKGLLSADELSFGSEETGAISEEVYTEFQATNDIPEDLKKTLAIKASSGLPLSDREQEIYDALKDEISAIPVNEDEEEVNDTEEEEQSNPEVEETPEVQPSENETEITKNGPDDFNDEASLSFFGVGTESTVESTEEGFNALAPNGTQINDEPLDTTEEAETLAEAFDKGKANMTWSTNFFIGTDGENDLDKIKDFIRRANTSLASFNKSSETPVETLEQYFKTPEGRRKLLTIRQAVLTGKSVKEIEKEAGPTVAIGTQVDLFETTSSIVDGPAVTLSSMQSLHEDLLKMMESKEDTSEIKETSLDLIQDQYKDAYEKGGFPDSQSNTRSNATAMLLDFIADVEGVPRFKDVISKGTYVKWLQDLSSLGYKVAENLNSPKKAFDLIAQYERELASKKPKPVPSTTAALQPKDLKLNVSASTKKAGMESITKQDSSIESFDENKFIRVTKANADDTNGKYYTIDNGVLRIRINGRDAVSGRTGGATQISVKVPVGFNEKIFAEKLKNISHKDGVTTDEAVQQVVNDVRNAIVESQKSTTKVSEKIDTFVEKGDVTEQSILDQLDDIHSCF
jgi:hypothetical protein